MLPHEMLTGQRTRLTRGSRRGPAVTGPPAGTVVPCPLYYTVTIAPPEGRLLEDSALVERAQDGDVGAYEELIRLYQEMAVRTAYLVAGSAIDADEVAQEAFVKAYFALPRFRPSAPFRPWLLRIVANEARNRRKASRRRENVALRLQASLPALPSSPSPEEEVLASERRAVLLDALNRLREEDRLTVSYRYFLGLSEEEMATALGCARGTVKSRLSRALGRLREALGAASRAETGRHPPAPGATGE